MSQTVSSTNAPQLTSVNSTAAPTPEPIRSSFEALDLLLNGPGQRSVKTRALHKRAGNVILKTSVDLRVIRKFVEYSREERLAILSAVRELDHSFRTRMALPVAGALLLFMIGLIATLGGTETGGLGVGAGVAAVFGMLSGVVILISAKHDAKQEARHNAWLKALETVDAEVVKSPNTPLLPALGAGASKPNDQVVIAPNAG